MYFIVEPLRKPFPYLKTGLNQNYPHNFSEMELWQHFCIDFHCAEQKQSNYLRDALNFVYQRCFFTPVRNRIEKCKYLICYKIRLTKHGRQLHKLIIFKLNSRIHNNRAFLRSSCLKSSITKSVYEWLVRYIHHTTSQIREDLKTQCLHGFRSY